MSEMQLVYLICLIVSVVITVVAFGLHFYFKNRNSKSFSVTTRDSIWEFTKRNFWMFLGCFGLVMIFSFGATLISYI